MTDTNTISYIVDTNGAIIFNNLPESSNLDMNISGISMIQFGDIASSKPLNDNFAYLNARVDYSQANIASLQTSITSNVNNILSTYQNVNDLNSSNTPFELESNKIYRITPENDIKFTLPTISDNTKFYQIYIILDLTTFYDVDLGTDWSFNDIAPVITEAGRYNILYEYDGAHWVCGIIKRSEVA